MPKKAMKLKKCQKCKEPIPKGKEKYIQAKMVCERCYNKIKYKIKVYGEEVNNNGNYGNYRNSEK